MLIDVPKDVGIEEFDYVPVAPGTAIPPGFQTGSGSDGPEAIAAALELDHAGHGGRSSTSVEGPSAVMPTLRCGPLLSASSCPSPPH